MMWLLSQGGGTGGQQRQRESDHVAERRSKMEQRLIFAHGKLLADSLKKLGEARQSSRRHRSRYAQVSNGGLFV
jgi:hypothetical protein